MVVTCSTDWWAFSDSRCTVVWRATRIPTTLNGWPQDPTMRIIVGRRDTNRPAASTNTMSRFETEVLTQDSNVEPAKVPVGAPRPGGMHCLAFGVANRTIPAVLRTLVG